MNRTRTVATSLGALTFCWLLLSQSDLYAKREKPASRTTASVPEPVKDGQLKELTLYKEALARWPNVATCEDFKALSNNSNFRLKDYAKLRSIIACPDFKEAVDFVDFAKPQFEPLRTEAELTLTEKQEKWDQYLEYLANSVTSYKVEGERVRIIEKAMALAKEKKLTSQYAKFEKMLYKVAPRLRKKQSREDYYEVGMDYLSAREFTKAREYLKKVADDARFPTEKRRQAYVAFRNSFKIEQDKRSHLKESQQYYQWLLRQKDWKHAFDAGVYVARALWTEGLQAQAEKILTELENKLSKKTKTFEVDFLRGRIAAEDGHDQKALVYYEKAIANGTKGSTIVFKAQYNKGWSLYRMNKMTEAATEFGKANELAIEQPDQIRCRYWQAKSLKRAGQMDEATELFRQIMKDDPIGFYGVLSYRDTDEPIPPVATKLETRKTAEAENQIESKHLNGEQRQLIADLSFVGEKKSLESLLNEISQKGHWDWESAEGIEFLRSYAKAGLYLPLFSMLTKIPKNMREELLLSHPELLFPQEYAETISASALKESVPAELIFAIIRQESAFDPFARSSADALGLMQVMPGSAKNIAKDLDVEVSHHDDLYLPNINIPIGTHLLKQGLDRYKNNLILAIASYNASDRAIKNWLKTRFRDDPLEFVEEIPYEETRSYVKLVLRNYVFYKRLKSPTQSMTFPIECLTSLQNFKTSTDKDVVSR